MNTDRIGDLIDKLSIINIKIWDATGKGHMAYEAGDDAKAHDLFLKVQTMNVQRKEYINAINEFFGEKENKPIAETWIKTLQDFSDLSNLLYHKCLDDLTPILGRKRAKESARFFKTFNSQITMDVMFNWRSFYHFQKLRNDEHAQKEIREIAKEMLSLVKNIEGDPFKYTIEAFGL